MAQALAFLLAHLAGQVHGFHQTDRAQRQCQRLLKTPLAQEIDFEAAAPQVGDQPRLQIAERGVNGEPHQPRLFGGVNRFQANSRFAEDSLQQEIAIFGFTHGAGCYGAEQMHVMLAKHRAEMAESVDGVGHHAGSKPAAREDVVPQAHGPALAGKK